MDNHGKPISKRELRRRQNEEKRESSNSTEYVVARQKQNAVEEMTIVGERSRIVMRRNTFTVAKSSTSDSLSTCAKDKINHVESGTSAEGNEETDIALQTETDDSVNMLTHTINGGDTWNTDSVQLTLDNAGNPEIESKHDTYNVQKISATDAEEYRPVPAPRKHVMSASKEPDRHSSDTDKDVAEIDVDEANESGSNSVVVPKQRQISLVCGSVSEAAEEAPKPKPRKLSVRQVDRNSFRTTESMSKSKSLEEIAVKVVSPRSVKSNPETKCDNFAREAVAGEPEREKASPAPEPKPRKGKKFSDILQRKRKRQFGKGLSKLEGSRIPTLSAILKDLKGDDASRRKLEEDEDKTDFPIDSTTCYPRSELSDHMYVQGKNGFYLKSREDVFKLHDDLSLNGETGGTEGSMICTMLRTAMLFQKFWSKSMMYFHGVLAGFGFGHAFTVTTILFYLNQESQRFMDIYACLALKIHFIFYSLIALCIISCLDRLDVGHLKKEHWERIFSEFPSLWFILMMYIASFALTFANHCTESKFDGHQYANVTGEKLWDTEVYKDAAEVFASWYRIIWARDMMVLAAWLLIALTEYPDHLHSYLIDLATKADMNKGGREHKVLSIIS